MNPNDPNRQVTIIAILCFLFFSSITIAFAVFAYRLRDLQQYIRSQNYHQVIQEEVEAQLAKRPLPVDGRNGTDGNDGINGRDGTDGQDGTSGSAGRSGKDGKDGKTGDTPKPCTTYTDEAGDKYVECPDGTKTIIEDGEDARQVEVCSTPLIPLGWRYVGSLTCMLPRSR